MKGAVAHIDELDRVEMPDGFVWRPVRRHFGIRAFGVNAYTAREAEGQIVEEHSEGSGGHQEIYVVLRGRVRFTVDGNEHELTSGQLVAITDPSLRRSAIALTDDAAVLALGGKPGVPHRVSSWEAMFAAFPSMERGDWDEAIRLHEEALAETPDDARLLYNLACMESRGGHNLDAILHLRQAIELDPAMAGWARGDSDFDRVRAEQGFPAT
jgi:tetratricopeptide (TPR) repeat protein